MPDKFANNRIIKIGIVCTDLDDTAQRFEKLFDQCPPPNGETEPPAGADYVCGLFKEYHGKRHNDVPMKTRNIYLDPIYLELIQPLDDTPSPWLDHLNRHGTSVCFISFYIEGFEQHIGLMADEGYPVVFTEEKGYERYAYFDTLEKLGFMLEIKERIPKLFTGKEEIK